MPQDVYIYNPNIPVPEDVRHVEIPKGVTVIGDDAFRDCSDLQSVTIPDSVTKINGCAFYGCSGLQSVTIPDSVTEIGDSAFENCADLQSITIPDSITKINAYTFAGCSALKSVTIPDSVTEIGKNAFAYCSELGSVTIPDSVTKIGGRAFVYCGGLQSVEIPDSITEIEGEAFQGCTGLQSVTIPDSVTEIGDGAFCECLNLQSVTIPNGITKINPCVFRGCHRLQSVNIPDGVTEIKERAFSGCSALQSVTIPDSVTKIGNGAFCVCHGLQSVTIPDGVEEIQEAAFYGCTGLQSVTIPDSITVISGHTFGQCDNLRSVMIPGSVKEIGGFAFNGCSRLRSVTIPGGVTEIGYSAFRKCTGLRSITIPDTVTKIGEAAFEECAGLQSVIIPDGVTKIDDSAFYACSGLQSVTIPDSVTEIGRCAFCGCSGLQSVTIPGDVAGINDSAFLSCPALQSLIYRGINIAPFINIDGYGVSTFDVIRTLIKHRIPLSENTVGYGIDMLHRSGLAQWARDYPVYGTMHLSRAMKSADGETEERLRGYFAAQKKTGCHIPKILDKLAIAAHICQIPPERLAETFDIRYTEALLRDGIPLVPAEACRCYYDRNVCDALIRKDKISVMAEAIACYNRSGHRECYRHLTDFILSHPDTKIEDLQYAVDNAEKIPMRAGITLTQIRQHRTYMDNLAEVTKIEAEYGRTVPGFRLSDYPCNIEPVSITYDGMTARVLDLSDDRDIALAAGLGELTNCCQSFGKAGETAMMHGFLNPDAGFWVIEDKDGKVKAQAEIWESDKGVLVFDNIEFTDTDNAHRSDRTEQLRGIIAAWAMESGYTDIIMGCGYNELGTGLMEQAPIPELRLTPEEVFALREESDADIFFRNIGEARRYMRTEDYRPDNFVYTDAGERCVYIKKDGTVSDYLTEGYDRALLNTPCSDINETVEPPGHSHMRR